MATEEKKPAELPEVEAPAETLAVSVPTTKPQSLEYESSEQLQRSHAADVFAQEEAKAKKAATSETDRLRGMLDKYIEQHSSTTAVRAAAKKNERTNEYQMDLSADLVEMLEKIKKSLR